MAESQSGAAPPDLDTVLDVVGVPVYTLDEQGHFTYVNDALVDLVGYRRSTLVGSHVSLVLREADVARCRAAIRELLETGGQSREVTARGETAEGESVTLSLSIALLPLDGGFRGTVGAVRQAETAA